jgi:hypothetical protein
MYVNIPRGLQATSDALMKRDNKLSDETIANVAEILLPHGREGREH